MKGGLRLLRVIIKDQIASKYNDRQIVSDAINFISIGFEFDSKWDGLDKVYQFTNGDVSVDIHTNKNNVQIPHEVLKAGRLAVKVRGTKLSGDGETIEIKATSNPVYYNIIDSELVEAGNAETVAPDVAEQIRQVAEQASVLANETYDKVVEMVQDVEGAIHNANTAANNADVARENIQAQYDDLAGEGRTTETVKGNADKINNKIKQSAFIATSDDTTNIKHNLSYDPLKDDLLVFYQGLLLYEDVNYKNNIDNISVDLLDWCIGNGDVITFKLYKDVK